MNKTVMREVVVPSKVDEMKKQLSKLTAKGDLLYYALADLAGSLSEGSKKILAEKKIDLPSFEAEYEPWYSEALLVVKQVLPDRVDDFVKQYKNEKRKEIDYLTYTISDALLSLTTRRNGNVVAEPGTAIPKMQIQVSILKSAEKRFESALFDISEVLQSDIFDSELDAASELSKKGFYRAAGAVAGVVLEKHLGKVCSTHNLKSRKKHPSISDFYQLLKDADVIDVPKWRFIQHLGDIRNLCDHGKHRDPNKDDIDDIDELVEGVGKVIKTVF
ncbi:hypothetical protein [Vreelandella alkaliphila]|nr:hypothetical protein [Halomonas humidisoli]